MPAVASSAALVVHPDRYRAARDLCRQRSPDLFFAAHFTSKPRRYALYALDGLAHQLVQIMGPPQMAAAPTMVAPPAEGCCSSGGCEGESIAQRQQVCLAVVDHLLSGQETGKPELDAFLDVQQAIALDRAWLHRWIAGLATERSLPRYATWKRLSDTFADSAGMLALMMARVLMNPTGGEAAPLPALLEAQLLATGIAMQVSRALQNIAHDLAQGRLLIPLDDLIKHQLTERDLATFAQKQSTGGDPRWTALMGHQLERVRNLLRGGAKALPALADEGSRRTFAAMGVFAMSPLERLSQAGGDPFATQIKLNAWQRLKAMPRAVRMVWDAK